MSRPNVLLVLADQWRGQDQGWIGNTQVSTPHLDRLAKGGVAVRAACASSPVCGPSRASLLTGHLPHTHGVVANDLPLSSDHPTLATVTQAAGYRTGWIGKWHLDGLPRDKWVAPSGRPGVDYWTGVDCSHRHLDGHYYSGEGQRVDYSGYEPEMQTDMAIDFLDAGAEPFFLTVSYGPPHDPYDTVPERYQQLYDTETIEVRANADDTSEQRVAQRLYWSAISAIDEQLGRLVAALDQRTLLLNTIIVVTSDHGDMLGSHGLSAKQTPYAESIRIPLVISWPVRLHHAEPGGVFGLVDLAPTLLGLMGLPGIGTYGRDLSRGLRAGGVLRDELLLGNWVSFDNGFDQGIPEWRGYCSEEETFARHADGTPWLLFDDRKDPRQQRNLVDGPDHQTSLRTANSRLDHLLSEAGDDALSAADMLGSVGMIDAWNHRERELRGDRARLITTSTGPHSRT